ncbi:serine hydrolase [Deinococcus cellulosilyticus]|uniref:Beta-lactamase class A catalytic domain-containing protein n=1 Tax=Deinococcus cellulosilyticus (strain DSM 18568 / NBRC 106333 / KACC 11606 / 5516J-15) TaxID=1223518 RepID=A0A511N4N5_DEIC1|nr:serine hydrolase [Deinococcus cellulosilyticus]GEM47802.1 hypothetical protein DC3_34370 [Deinococcus cellulosilyticus NBRC 106333 = KACC 11606]
MHKILLISAALAGVSFAQFTQAVTPEQALARLFTQGPIKPEWFAPEVLKQVPLAQIQAVITGIAQQGGAFQKAVPAGQDFTLEFEKTLVTATLRLDAQGKITTLLFKAVKPRVKDLREAMKGYFTLPGKFSVVVMKNGQVLQQAGVTEPLAVGSTFKLAVLAALQEQIEAKKLGWDTVVTLEPQDISLPSGQLQDWYPGAHFTLETLAGLMVSQSDNTATDALIRILGREAIEKFLPAANQPLLTTRNLFALRDAANKSALELYLKGDVAAKREVLKQLDQIPAQKIQFSGTQGDLRAEWLLTPTEACTLMSKVQNLKITQINPGVVNPADWKQVSYKGGSEVGVLNLTTALLDQAGNTYCVSATWNHTQAIDDSNFIQLYMNVLGSLE